MFTAFGSPSRYFLLSNNEPAITTNTTEVATKTPRSMKRGKSNTLLP